ncbi:MAG: hypothetical protein L6Q37_11635 [Bdellovibrionaceae bacterium]|nr:hypothetical protein [Pseudobdellovibrionaceae bacterium]NUM59833.1 hypothetical protein [Pseudobdellovibrionaceae bacterium]
MINLKKFLVLITTLKLLTSCSNPLGSGESHVDPNYGGNEKKLPAPTQFQPVAGSKLSQTSMTGTKVVDVTVGSTTGTLKLKTTKNRTTYLSVQGQILSN